MEKSAVLVVGGAGYIGAHAAKDLAERGCEVVVLDDLSRGHREFARYGAFIQGDLGDRLVLDEIFKARRIDAVMHFAAYSLVGESCEKPLDYYRNNVAKTTCLLEAMIRHQVKRFIFSSSAAVYGEPLDVPIVEDHPCNPINPYGSSKRAVENLLEYCDRAYGLKYVSLRYFNAAGADPSGEIGERHAPETHLIPLVLTAALGLRDGVEIFGVDYPTPDGACLRDYVHVNDLSSAHLLAFDALMSGAVSAVYNLGNSRGYSVREVIEAAKKATGRPIRVVESGRRPGDPAVLIAGADRIRRELGWKPRCEDLERIIETAWKWHQKEALRQKSIGSNQNED